MTKLQTFSAFINMNIKLFSLILSSLQETLNTTHEFETGLPSLEFQTRKHLFCLLASQDWELFCCQGLRWISLKAKVPLSNKHSNAVTTVLVIAFGQIYLHCIFIIHNLFVQYFLMEKWCLHAYHYNDKQYALQCFRTICNKKCR